MSEVNQGEESGLAKQALAVFDRGQSYFASIPSRRRNRLVASALVLLALISAIVWQVYRPDWKVLYSGLEARDAALVTQELGAAGITFRTTSDQSSVEVPVEFLDKARMEIAAKGMPQTGRLGFELFDKPNWVGSEFDEKVNYQRALEGELEHTIGTLNAVKSARVHLVIPPVSLFTQDEKLAKASVVLKLRGSRLEAEQVDVIRRLVAGAVDNLSPASVVLVDADGRLDLNQTTGRARQGEAEQALEAKLVAMIEPTVGIGNVKAIVNATYDEGSEERTDEIYDPSAVAALSMQKSEQIAGLPASGAKASGVPGTASNSPAAAAPGAVQGSATATPGLPPLLQGSAKDPLPVFPDKGAVQGQSTREENGTFGVTKHTLHREDAPGRLLRITVAVLVNDRLLSGGIWKPRSSEEMHRLEGLAQAAVGYDQKRGDQVTLENVSFNANALPADPAQAGKLLDQAKGLLQSQPALTRTVVSAALGILVILFILRPISRQVVASLKEPLPLSAGNSSRAALGPNPIIASLPAGAGAERLETLNAVAVEQVAERIRNKPTQSTRLLENWIAGSKDAG